MITLTHVFIAIGIYFIISLLSVKLYDWFILHDDNCPPPLELFCIFWIVMIPLCFLMKLGDMIEKNQITFINFYQLLYNFKFKQWLLERKIRNSVRKYLK